MLPLVVFALVGAVTGLAEVAVPGALGELVASCVAGMDDIVDGEPLVELEVSLGVEAMVEALDDEGAIVELLEEEGGLVVADVEGVVVELASVLLRSQPAMDAEARANAAIIGISFFMGSPAEGLAVWGGTSPAKTQNARARSFTPAAAVAQGLHAEIGPLTRNNLRIRG